MASAEEKKTALELLAGGGRHVAAAVAALLVYPLIARTLSAGLLGAWALLSTAGFLLSLSDLGLTTAVHRAAVTSDHARARRAVALAQLSICALSPVLAAGSYFFLVDVAELSAKLGQSVQGAAIVTLGGGVISAFAYPYRGFVLARGGISAIATARAASSVAQLGATIAAVMIERSLLAPAVGYVAGAIVELSLTVRAAARIDPSIVQRPRMPEDRGEAAAALRDGMAALAINLSSAAAVRVDVFVLSRIAPLATVAAYGVAARAVDVSYLIAKQSTAALLPRLGDPARRETAVRVALGIFTGVIAAGMIALALAGQPLLVGWVGPVAEGRLTAYVLAMLAAAAILQATSDVPGSMLTLGSRTAWASAVPIAIGASVNITISITGAPHYGFWAVAGSTVAGNLITTLLMWRKAFPMLGWGPEAALRAFFPAIASGVVAAAIAWPLSGYAARGLLQSLLVCAAAMISACIAILLAMSWSGQRPAAAATSTEQ